MESETSGGRRTPYEVVFGVERLGEREFPALLEEAERQRAETGRRDHFAQLEGARSLLRQLVPESVDPEALDRYLDILFHCFNFWRAGCPMYACEAALARNLVEAGPDLRGWRPRTPHPALYVELPKNLFWAAVAEEQPPEPAEGLFVSRVPGAGARAEILVVLGMRLDRPGFSAAGLSVDLEASGELSEPDSFSSEIPGAELAGLYSLKRSSEAVLLLSRLLWYLEAYPESVQRVRGAESGAPHASGQPTPTALDYYRVRLVERSRG